jgi:hypothetical protein
MFKKTTKQENKKTITLIGFVFLFFCFFAFAPQATRADTLTKRLRGRLLLQAQDHGQVWYVNPVDDKRYEVTADNILTVFRALALGITNADLNKIPTDTNFLNAQIDSDGDGYLDIIEADNGYNVFGPGKAQIDKNLTARLRGRLLLQVENRGQIWYVNPVDDKKYMVQTATALPLFRQLALGITDADLSQITATANPSEAPEIKNGDVPLEENPKNTSQTSYVPEQSDSASTAGAVMSAAANAVRSGNAAAATPYFTPAVRKAVSYTMGVLDSGGKFLLGNLLSSATLANNSAAEAVYTANVSFNGQNVTVNFRVQKQADGSWLLANL